jgi:Galactose oxidase, central domain
VPSRPSHSLSIETATNQGGLLSVMDYPRRERLECPEAKAEHSPRVYAENSTNPNRRHRQYSPGRCAKTEGAGFGDRRVPATALYRTARWSAVHSLAARRLPRSVRLWDSLAVCFLLAIPSSALITGNPGTSVTTADLADASTNQSAVGQQMIAEAEASLEQGEGPANGAPVSCLGSAGSLSCSGGSINSTPSHALPTAVTPSFPTYSSPSPRFGAPWTDVRDALPMTDFLLLFGGANSSGQVFNDTWSYLYPSSSTSWVNETSTSCGGATYPCPAARHDQALVWDSKDEYVLMFGGCGAPTVSWIQSTPGCPSSDVYGDTWKWIPSSVTLGQGRWSQVKIDGSACGGPGQGTCPSGVAPSARYAAGIAAAPSTAPILFGGCGASTCPLNDTWTFQGGGSGWGNWTKLSPAKSPSVRYGSSMVYDYGDGYTLLFGGCGTNTPGCSSAALYGDTWEYTSSGGWTQIGSCGGPGQSSCSATSAPSKRYFALISCPYTSNTGPTSWDYVSLADGTTGSVYTTVLNDTWSYNRATWTKIPSMWKHPPPPAPRFDGDWLDRVQEADFLQAFGGTSPSGSSLGDNYLQDPSANSPVGPRTWPPVTPSPRGSFSLAYDGAYREVVMFGGCGEICPSNETWVYGICAGVTPPIEATSCSTVLQNQLVWVNLTGTGPAPSARTNAVMAYDYRDRAVILFGGINANGTVLGDTWSFNGYGWSQMSCSLSCPPARQRASMSAYNLTTSNFEGVILFGGFDASGGLLDDTWFYVTGVWSPITGSTPPSARAGAGMSWDGTDNYLLLFGGDTSSGLSQQSWKLYGTSTLNLSWTQLPPTTCTPSTCPAAEAYGGMDFDANDGYVVLFENGNPTCSVSSCWTTWGFASGSWTLEGSPPSCLPTCAWPLVSAPIAYSGAANFVLLFGGWTPNGSLSGHTYAWGHGSWVADSLTNPTPSELAPSPAGGASMAFDPSLGAVILVGGCFQVPCQSATGGNPGMWGFEDGAWHFAPLSTTAPNAPDRLAFASLAYLPTIPGLFLFGGFQTPGGPLNSETWKLTGSTLATLGWAQATTSGPSQRWGAAMAYDSTDHYLVLFGGCGSTPNPTDLASCTSLLGDTWTFNGVWSSLGVLSNGPSVRFGASVATGSTGSGVYLVDGFGSSGPVSQEWEFASAAWTKLSVVPPFSSRWGAAMDYDSLEGFLVLYGGFELNSSGGIVALNDTWVESLNGNWAAIGAPPYANSPEGFGSLVFDPNAGGDGWNLQFGGTNSADWQIFGTTWYFTDTSGWVDISPWT